MAPSRAPKLTGLVVLLAGTISPGIVLTLLGLPAAGSAASLGAIGGGIAIISTTRKNAAWASLAMGIAVFLAVSTASVSFVTVGVFVLIGLFVGAVNVTGISAAFVFVPISAGFALTQPSVLTQSAFVNGLFLGLVTLGAGLVPVFLVRMVAKTLPVRTAPVLARNVVIGYAVNLALLLGLASFLTIHFALNHLGAWLILTIAVIVQPSLQATWTKGLQRAGGTVLGFFIAVGVAGSIPLPGLFALIGNLFIVLALLGNARNRPYWQYAMFLTPGIVLLDGSNESILATADDRLLATFVGALICLVVLMIERPFYKAAAAKAGVERY
jgi:hypothetical protein